MKTCTPCQSLVEGDILLLWAVRDEAETTCPSLNDEHLASCTRCRERLAPREPQRFKFPLKFAAAIALAVIGFVILVLVSPRHESDSPLVDIEPIQEMIPAAYLSHVEGAVQLGDRTASVNQAVKEGDSIVTGAGQRAKVELPDGAELYLNENSHARVVDLRKPPYHLELEHGNIVFAGGVIVDTVEGTADARHGEVSLNTSGEQVAVTALSGEAEFRTATKEVKLGTGQQVIARHGKLEPFTRPNGPAMHWLEKMRGKSIQISGLPGHWKVMPPNQPDAFRTFEKDHTTWIALKPARKENRRMTGMASMKDLDIDKPFTLSFELAEPVTHPSTFASVGLQTSGPRDQRPSLRVRIGMGNLALVARQPGQKEQRLWTLKRPPGNLRIELSFVGAHVTVAVNGIVKADVTHSLPLEMPARLEIGSGCGPNAPADYETWFGNLSVQPK